MYSIPNLKDVTTNKIVILAKYSINIKNKDLIVIELI